MPLVIVVVAVILLLLMITWWKLNPFVALIIAAVGVGIASGMRPTDIVLSIKDGMGGTLSLLALVLPLGTMLGKMMAESGGAERIANTLIQRFGQKNVHWAMMVVAFLVGIPVFFQVGFVLLVPLVFTIAKETGISLVKIGIPLVAGLSTVHGLVPPHPAPMTAIGLYQANVGRTIIYSLIVGIPTAIISGPLYGGRGVQQSFAKLWGRQVHRGTRVELQPLAAVVGVDDRRVDPRRHRLGNRRDADRCRDRRPDSGHDDGREHRTARVGDRCRLADPLARQRLGILDDQGILRHDREGDVAHVDGDGDDPLPRGVGADSAARPRGLSQKHPSRARSGVFFLMSKD
ncbi:GntP family permease [Tumebacillus permanentifrigoris]|uniref:GntP family permease n=1 Tax=Tumebacillus permanentifrigoris TaxID=378543 RepID=A0A316D6A6_9BACL|nr:GntP family permease [Tumebacillus permanentifrigoris]